MDEKHVQELQATWPTWIHFHPEFATWPMLAIVDSNRSKRFWSRALKFIKHPSLTIFPWDQAGTEQREKMISAWVYVPGTHVSTPWYLKLDTDAIATSRVRWPLDEWFEPNSQGQSPVFVSSPWSYTKPGQLIDQLQSWGDEGPLSEFPRLPIASSPDSARLRHSRIISWCFFGNTEWTKAIAALAPQRLPVASQDTFHWYCAARRGDFYRTVRMSKHGWIHLRGIRRIRRAAALALKTSIQPTTRNHKLNERPQPRGDNTALLITDNESAVSKTAGEELVKIVRPLSKPGFRGAEVGVLSGGTSRVLLKALPDLFLYMVDTWTVPHPQSAYTKSGDSAARQHWSQQLANEQLAYDQTLFASQRRVLLRAESQVAGAAVADASLDFAFLDADHTFEAVQLDIKTWWPKIKPGGILAGHDYDCRRDRRGLWGVRRAVDAFANQFQLKVTLGRHHVWWVQKNEGSRNQAGST